MKYYTLKVIDIRYETIDAVTVVFKQPGLKKIHYLPGQYLTVIFKINGRRYLRPYSFSSAPKVDQHLEITVKRINGGVVSNHIFDKLKTDDLVEVMEPMGDFTLNADVLLSTEHIMLWGAGSGITPLISIIKSVLFNNPEKHVTLIYGNHDSESAIFHKKIEALKNHHENFSAWHFHSRPVEVLVGPYFIEGRIDANLILPMIASKNDIEKAAHYICGPVDLKKSIKTTLLNLSVNNDKIFSEDFEVIRNPADFEDIVTQTVSLRKGDERFVVEVAKGKSILDSGLDAMIELCYSCQTGNCLVCKARLTNGKIKMIGIEKVPEGLEKDEYLLCSSFPLTDNVEIEVY